MSCFLTSSINFFEFRFFLQARRGVESVGGTSKECENVWSCCSVHFVKRICSALFQDLAPASSSIRSQTQKWRRRRQVKKEEEEEEEEKEEKEVRLNILTFCLFRLNALDGILSCFKKGEYFEDEELTISSAVAIMESDEFWTGEKDDHAESFWRKISAVFKPSASIFEEMLRFAAFEEQQVCALEFLASCLKEDKNSFKKWKNLVFYFHYV